MRKPTRRATRRIAAAATLALAAIGSGLGTAEAKPKPAALAADTAITNDGRVVEGANLEGVSGMDGNVGSAPSPETAESIIGADQRVRIFGTTSYPARAIGMISRNGAQHCTGWLISKDTVLTAGHCVHSGGPGGTWYSGLRFSAGRNDASAPYGYCGVRPGGLTSFVGWVNNGDEQHDAGIMKLNCSVGNTTGWFGYWWQSASLNGAFTRVQGYPGDKGPQQWLSTGSVTNTSTYQLFYQNDTVGGMSGSPIWQNRSGQPFCNGACAMGIHAYGLHNGNPHGNNNHGTRNTQAKFNVYVNIATAP